jgi:hypothetical protein
MHGGLVAFLWVPKTRFSQNHAHLSRRIPGRAMPQPDGGMGTQLSAGAIEQREGRDECARN